MPNFSFNNVYLKEKLNSYQENSDIIVENVRMIFGEEHKDLFIRFKRIIGVRN